MISMDFLVREAQPNDAKAIVDVLNPIIEAGLYTAFDTPFTVEAERTYILNLPHRGVFHVAERRQDMRIVAFQSMEPFATYTHAFDHVGVLGTFVDLSQRRQGIASRLFEVTFERGKISVSKGPPSKRWQPTPQARPWLRLTALL
jgi:L-amino acid N-acyltransferase YncA